MLEVPTQRRLWRFRDRTCYFNALYFIDDDRALCCVSHTGTVYFLDVVSGRALKSFSTGKTIWSAKVLADGTQMLAGLLNDVALWDLRENREIKRYPGHDGEICSIELTSRQDRFVAIAAFGKSVCYWCVESTSPLRRIPMEQPVCFAALDPSGATLFTIDSPFGAVRKWSLINGTQSESPKDIKDKVFRVASHPIGSHLAVGYSAGGIGLVEVSTGNEGFRTDAPADTPSVLAFSPDGRYVLAGTLEGWVALVKMIY